MYNKENAAMFFNNILDFGSEDLKEQLTELFLDGLSLYKEQNQIENKDSVYIDIDVLDVLKYVLDVGEDKVQVCIQNNKLLNFFVINKS